MARPTKSHQFTIYEDDVVQLDDTKENDTEESDKGKPNHDHHYVAWLQQQEAQVTECTVLESMSEEMMEEETQYQDVHDADDERRESNITSTSISSFPDSYYLTENDEAEQPAQVHTPPIIRPRFRRPESVRRMQMTSPPPYGHGSPRHSVLSHSRSRNGTPKSARSVIVRRSPGPKKRPAYEDTNSGGRDYPLVLLHISVTPVNLPWTDQSIREVLTPVGIENLRLLKSKLSETVLQRGILIPHPGGEYELLEERLLEALELKEERVTKCGHFRRRDSTASTTDSGQDSDSGVGSSADGSDYEVCATCRKYIKTSTSTVGSGKTKWTMKIFAANGLMRSSAWSAAWSDMESVDVEILPWISDDARQKLDERRAREIVEDREKVASDESRIRGIVQEEVLAALHKQQGAIQRSASPYQQDPQFQMASPILERTEVPDLDPPISSPPLSRAAEDLPRVYKPSQIPLSILLKNYVLLLAQDRRNLAIFFLSAIVLAFAIGQTSKNHQGLSLPHEPPILAGNDAAYHVLRGPDMKVEEQDGFLDSITTQPIEKPLEATSLTTTSPYPKDPLSSQDNPEKAEKGHEADDEMKFEMQEDI